MADYRQTASFKCSVCGTVMEEWNTWMVPTYRLIAGPIRMPDAKT
jgi:hypothetical protein